MNDTLPIKLSPMDEMRFGVRTAKMNPERIENVRDLEVFCEQQSVDLAITRVPADHLDVVQEMERQGYRLMDTLLYYAFKLDRTPIPDDSSPYLVRPVQRASEAQAVRTIASASFKGYFGHYHADVRLDREACDEVYRSWAENSVLSADVAHEVLVVEDQGELLGFATLRLNSAQVGEGVLFGVAPQAQGKGIYRTMMVHGMRWCQQQGAERMIVSTQITNVAVQKVWARLGFEFDHAYYTLHKWFDRVKES
jgi:GNAT superfamily N-acetyltransferase